MRVSAAVRLSALALILAACGGAAPQSSGVDAGVEPTAVPRIDPLTRVADDATRQVLASLSFDNAAACQPEEPPFSEAATQNTLNDVRGSSFVRCQARFTFNQSTPFLADLKPGNLLVGQPGPGAPYGYLQRVKSVTSDGERVVVIGEQASLDDALIEGEFDQNLILDPAQLSNVALAPGVARSGQNLLRPQASFDLNINKVLFDADGKASTTNDQVRIKGRFNLGADNGLSLGLRWKKILGVPIYPNGITFKAVYGFNQRADLRVEVDLDVNALDKEVELAKYRFSPITFFVGPVPVVLIPSVRVTSDLKGNVKARMTFGATENVTAQAGFEYRDGFRNISEFSKNFSRYLDVNPVVGSVEAGLNLQGDILLYGLVGPYVRVRPVVVFDAAIPRDPIWKLSAKMQGYVGVHADLLVKTLKYDAKIFDVGLSTFAQSDPLPPTISITSPLNGSQIQRNGTLPAGVCVNGQDPQFGQVPADVTANGVPVGRTSGGGLSNCVMPPASIFSRLGPITFVATVRNTQGQVATAISNVTVVNTPPTLTLQYSGDPRQGEDYSIAALITDVNEFDASTLCANTAWSVTAPDTLASPTGCNQRVKFGTTGIRQVSVTTRDSDGATTSQVLTRNVLPPPVNPYPRVTSASVNSRELLPGEVRFCARLSVSSGSTIDLRQEGCSISSIGPGPTRYFASAVVENPSGEALTYDWKLFATTTSEALVYTDTASTLPTFEMPDNGSSALATNNCRVTLTVNAPDPSRSKTQTVWTGKCTYHTSRLN